MKMKLSFKALAAVFVIAVCGVAAFSYFHVGGRGISSISAIDETCEVKIVKHDMMDEGGAREYVLKGPQIGELKQLLQESSYTRRLTFLNEVSYDTVSYGIYVFFDDHQEALSLVCTGGDFMSVHSTFEEKDQYDLKINNKDWKTALEEILQSAVLTEA